MLRIGQKVICIGGNWQRDFPEEVMPVTGEVYTIRAIIHYDDFAGLQFFEIRNPALDYEDGTGPVECNFNATKFRPVVNGEADISIFKAMLNPSNLREEV